jgi:homogentisate 1,2-dioxygenase
MTPHGPDTATYEASLSQQQQQPSHLGHNTLAFMFETSLTPRVTPAALGSTCIDRDYYKCWVGLKSHFDREWHSKQQQQQQQDGEPVDAATDMVEATGGAVLSKAAVS